MPRNTLEGIVYQHVIYGAGTILSGQSNIKSALIQPEDLEVAIAQAKPLFDAEDAREALQPNESGKTSVLNESSENDEYDVKQAHSDLQQILDVYNATVIDGRYIDELATNPKSVAAKLGVDLSDSAASALKEAGVTVANHFARRFALSGGKKIVAIVIVVGIAIRAEEKPYRIVVDSSGLVKA